MASMEILEKVQSVLSVKPVCPRCKCVIPSEDINVAKDIAFCRRCDVSHALSALTSETLEVPSVDASRPPAGAWFQRNGDGLVIGATHRAIGQALGMLFFALFWNGIVSVFVSLALVSTLHHLGLALPAWLPAPKGSVVPVPLTIFLWVFLTPFIAVGLAVLAMLLSSLAGRTEIRIERGEGVLFRGVGPLGFRKRFSTSGIKDVRLENKSWQDSRGITRRRSQIVVDASPQPLNFGSMLTEKRREFVAGVLRQELIGPA